VRAAGEVAQLGQGNGDLVAGLGQQCVGVGVPRDRYGEDEVLEGPLRDAIVDGWLAGAPPDLANAHIEQERRAARRP
jgi:hypothetical protein